MSVCQNKKDELIESTIQINSVEVALAEKYGALATKSREERNIKNEKIFQEIIGSEREMLEGKVFGACRLNGGINESHRGVIEGFGTVIIKSKRGEYPLTVAKDIPVGTYYLRERAAYIVDRFLGLDCVPKTVIREDIDRMGGPSSVQQYVDGQEMETSFLIDSVFNKEMHEKYPEGFSKLLIFDYIIWNCDRNERNIRVGEKPWAIDNSLSFLNSEYVYGGSARTFHLNFEGSEGMEIGDDTKKSVINLTNDYDKLEALHQTLLKFISKNEVQACINRIVKIAKLLESGKTLHSKDFYKFNFGG